jgi:hypothetical protein
MTEDSKKQDMLLETTDSLEAIATLKSNKNFFFIVCFICLFLLQVCFWLMFTEHIAADANDTLSSVARSAETTTTVTSAAQQTVTVESSSAKIEQTAQTLTAEPNVAKVAKTEPNAIWHKYANDLAHVKIRFSQLSWVIRICDYLLIVSAMMYSLTLLFGLKISLVARLGGISHITKAFFVSLFMIVMLLPWQVMFRGVIVGAIYTPSELLASWQAFAAGNFAEKSFMFIRYTGLAIVVILLLVWAQLKSMRWSKNTLKRLGIMA